MTLTSITQTCQNGGNLRNSAWLVTYAAQIRRHRENASKPSHPQFSVVLKAVCEVSLTHRKLGFHFSNDFRLVPVAEIDYRVYTTDLEFDNVLSTPETALSNFLS
jgi:hypothetical protein